MERQAFDWPAAISFYMPDDQRHSDLRKEAGWNKIAISVDNLVVQCSEVAKLASEDFGDFSTAV